MHGADSSPSKSKSIQHLNDIPDLERLHIRHIDSDVQLCGY